MDAAARRLLIVIGAVAFVRGLLPGASFDRLFELSRGVVRTPPAWIPYAPLVGGLIILAALYAFGVRPRIAAIVGLLLLALGGAGEHLATDLGAYLSAQASTNLGRMLCTAAFLALAVECLPRRWLLLAPLTTLVLAQAGNYLSGVTFDVLVPEGARPTAATILLTVTALGAAVAIAAQPMAENGEVAAKPLRNGARLQLLSIVVLATLGTLFFLVPAVPLGAPPLGAVSGLSADLLRFALWVLVPAALLGWLLHRGAGLGEAIRMIALAGIVAIVAGWAVLPLRGWAGSFGNALLPLLISLVTLRIAIASPLSGRMAAAFLPALVMLIASAGGWWFHITLVDPSSRSLSGHPAAGTVLLLFFSVVMAALLSLPRSGGTGRVESDLTPTPSES